MSNVLAIYKREMRAYFTSPIAYVLLFVFLLLAGVLFGLMFASYIEYAKQMSMQSRMGQQIPSLNDGLLARVYFTISIFLMLMTPMITMRLFSEEQRSGTMDLLQTLPLGDGQVVMGKFLAAMSVVLVMLGSTLIYPAVLFAIAKPEVAPIYGNYLGLVLLSAVYISFGMLVSSLTDNQIIAGFATFGLMFVISQVGTLGNLPQLAGTGFATFFQHVSIFGQLEKFLLGVVHSTGVVFFLNFTLVCLFLTFVTLQSRRWRG